MPSLVVIVLMVFSFMFEKWPESCWDRAILACRDNGRVAKSLIGDRDWPHVRKQVADEASGDMARSHLDEDFRSQLAQDFEGVVPADGMGDAGRQVQAYPLRPPTPSGV